MSDHLYSPPIDPAALVSAFNAGWITFAPLGHDAGNDIDVVLDCGTAASDSMIALCNISELSAANPLPYLRVGSVPRDAALAGRSWNDVLDAHVEAGMVAWRTRRSAFPSAAACAASAAPPTAPPETKTSATASKSSLTRKALQAWCVELMAQLRDPSQAAAPVATFAAQAAAPSAAPAAQQSVGGEDAALAEVLESLPTAFGLAQQWQQRWGSAAYFSRRGGPAFAGIQRTIDERRNVLSDLPVRVPGASPYDLRSRAVPPLPTCGAAATNQPAQLPPHSVVYTVAVFHDRLLRRDQEFIVLGEQTLDALRDRIYCLADHSGGPLGSGGPGASYLYVDGVLYDDRRPGREVSSTVPAASSSSSSPRPARYLSHEVEEWARAGLDSRRSLGWGPLRGGSMQATRFVDLRPRLGAHYVYCHQGSCQHVVVFMDARLLSATPGYDALDASFYPRHTFQAAIKRRMCSACKRAVSRYATFGDPLTVANPTYLCARCHELLHSDSEGRVVLRGAIVVPYLHD